MFRLTKDNRSWFQGISKNFKTQFDMYYLCLMMGLAANHKSNAPDTGDLIDYWPKESSYDNHSNFIIGLILLAEARNFGIDITNKEVTKKHLNTFLDPNEHAKLSLKTGFKEANRYAGGGCEIMRDQWQQKPNLFGVFLKNYQEELRKQLENNKDFT